MIDKIIIASRDSKLALIQAKWVQDKLKDFVQEVEIRPIVTKGDRILDQALSKIGDKGLFTKELETELLAGTVDLAVHSMKDLPTQLPQGLEIIATSQREDIRDVLCFKQNFQSINQVRTIGTSSLRRIAQLRYHYPHLNFVDIRGNLETRLRKLDQDSNIDAIVLAAAGLHRLGLESRIGEYLDPQIILPAVGQGALAIEIASDRDELKDFLRSILNSTRDELLIKAERSFLRTVEGGCQLPIGVYSSFDNSTIKLQARLLSLDAKQQISESISGQEAEKLGIELGNKILKLGARELLAKLN